MPTPGPDRWVWDLYPLSRHSWGNLQQPNDGTAPGHTITVRRDSPRRHFAADGSVTLFGAFTQSRRFYVPTDDDLRTLRQRFPKDDPAQPAWFLIKAALIVAGNPASTLERSEAPVLLALLARTDEPLRKPSAVPDEHAIYLSPSECIDRLPLEGLTKRQKRHQLDRIRKLCSWVRRNPDGHIHEGDWRLIVAKLRQRSTSKSNVADAVDPFALDLSREEIAARKDVVKSSNLAVKRSRK